MKNMKMPMGKKKDAPCKDCAKNAGSDKKGMPKDKKMPAFLMKMKKKK